MKFWFKDGIFNCLFLNDDLEYILLLLLIIFSIALKVGELYPVLLVFILELLLFETKVVEVVFSFELSLNLSNNISFISFSFSSILSSILVK